MPTPPERCTFAPICAHEPTVAHVSTMVPGADPRADVHVAGHQDRRPARGSAVAATAAAARRARPRRRSPCFSGSLSWYSNGPDSIVSIPRTRKYSRIAFFTHAFTIHPSSVGSATRTSPRSSSADRVLHRRGVDVPVLRREARLDARGQVGVGVDAHACTSRSDSAPSRISTARAQSSSVAHHRHPDVALPLRPEERPGRDDESALQQLQRPREGRRGRRAPRPTGTCPPRSPRPRRPAAGTGRGSARASRRSADAAPPRGPRRSRRRRTRVGRTPAASRRSRDGAPSSPRSAAASPAMNPERYPVMFERLLSVLSTTTFATIAELQARGRRPVVEPQLAVRLVERQQDVVSARQVGGVLEERRAAPWRRSGCSGS